MLFILELMLPNILDFILPYKLSSLFFWADLLKSRLTYMLFLYSAAIYESSLSDYPLVNFTLFFLDKSGLFFANSTPFTPIKCSLS